MNSIYRTPLAVAALAGIVFAGGSVLAQDAAKPPADSPQQGERLDRDGRFGRAGKGRMRHGRGHDFAYGRAAELIGLTDEQRTRIEEIRKADAAALEAAHTAMAEKRRSLEEAINAEPANQATIDSLINELSVAQTEVTRVSTGTRLKVLQVLTPDQRTKLREAREQHRSRFKP